VHIRFRQYLCRRREADSITIFEALEAWKDLLVATAGASAALAGLVTVAIATNIGEILKFPWLPSRAATSIGLLVLVLVVSIAGLMRPQTLVWVRHRDHRLRGGDVVDHRAHRLDQAGDAPPAPATGRAARARDQPLSAQRAALRGPAVGTGS
jgi:hypothetical protein